MFLFIIALLFFIFFLQQNGFDLSSAIAIAVFIYYFRMFFLQLNKTIAFREFVLLLYATNYLLAPALVYQIQDDSYYYGQKIPAEDFFILTIPALFLLQFGLFIRSSKIFEIDFLNVVLGSALNQKLLTRWLMFGIAISLMVNSLPAGIAFIGYLLAMIKYIAAYGLFIINRKKYKFLLFGLIIFEVLNALRAGMFGDLLMWVVLTFLLWCFLFKPSTILKTGIFAIGILVFFVIQISKGDYRSKTWAGSEESGFSTFTESATESLAAVDFEGGDNQTLLVVLTRLNQGWIFASTVKNMDEKQNFQQLNLLKRYLASAILPRFLAPDKINSGDKEVFNKFSGHYIKDGTSMGLGVLADGYIAYGRWGVYLFTFGLGLLFYVVFRLVETWIDISPFFVLFMYPIFFYAVRPDCETQTLLGHMVKSTLIFSVVVYYYKKQFGKRINLQSLASANA